MHQYRGYIALGLLGLALSNSCWAWGRTGHETVGYIAGELIRGSNAEQRVAQILGPGTTLAMATLWADCAKGYCNAPLTPDMKDYVDRNPRHKHYHYTDAPFQLTAYHGDAVGASEEDIVQTLRDAILVLKGAHPTDARHNFLPRDALMILTHMMGDLHQPLHVGTAYVAHKTFIVPATQDIAQLTSTVGGNTLCVGTSALHSLWDDIYVNAAMGVASVSGSAAFGSALHEVPSPSPIAADDLELLPREWAT